jgi:hypothetical protein
MFVVGLEFTIPIGRSKATVSIETAFIVSA